MQTLTLPANRGWQWLLEGFNIFCKQPQFLAPFVAVYFFLLSQNKIFPWPIQLLVVMLFPAGFTVVMNICRAVDKNLPMQGTAILFGLQENIKKLMAQGLIFMFAATLIITAIGLIDSSVPFMRPLPENGGYAMTTLNQLTVTEIVGLSLLLPVGLAYWFAPILVAWHNFTIIKSLFFSFFACLRNWRVFLVYVLSVLVFASIAPYVLSKVLLLAVSNSVALFILVGVFIFVILPTLYASFYVSYREIFVTIDENA